MKSLSLKAQILVLLTVVVTVVIFLLTLLTFGQVRRQLYRSLAQKAQSVSAVVAENAGPGLEFQDSIFVGEIAQGVFQDEDVLGVWVYDINNTSIFCRVNDPALATRFGAGYNIDSLIVRHLDAICIVERPIFVRGEKVGCLRLAATQSASMARIRDTIAPIVTGAAAMLIFSIIVGLFMSRRLVRPIQTFEEAAARISTGDMASAINLTVLHRDFLSLGTSFNNMRTALQKAFNELNQSRDQLELQVAERTQELRAELAERQKVEEALRAGEEVLKATIESTADGILVVNAGGKVITSNARFAKMWHIPDGLFATGSDRQLIDYVLDQLVDPDGFLTRVQTLYKSTEEDYDVIYFKDGRVFERYSCPLMKNGDAAGRVWSFRDVTDRVRAEEQRMQLQEKLERAERMEALGVLAGGVAHDLNNMLGPVVGYADLILMKLDEANPIRKQVMRIGKSAQDAANIIQDLLTLARRGRCEMTPTRANDVIRDYLDSAAFQQLSMQRTDVRVDLHLATEDTYILGSAPHLSKIIMNLVVNAYEAMPNGGTLTIETSRRYLNKLYGGYERVDPGEYIVLRVRDTGVGIDPKDMGKIFEPYYSKKKMGSSGSGLGLAIVYGIVKDHRGYYDIMSEIGKGTEFILYFPVTQVRNAQQSEEKSDYRGTETVLVVDDVADQRDLSVAILTSFGYSAVAAENGRAAVQYLINHTVDLVLLDMIMEKDFDGLDAYSEIIKYHPGQKCIIISGYSATERVSEMQKLGAGRYLRKPYTRETLGKAVREELDGVLIPAPPHAN